MDPTIMAATAIGLVAPYLAKAGEVVSKNFAEDIYKAIKARMEAKPAAREAMHDLKQSPSDADAQAAARQQLKKLLSADQAFAAEIEKLLKEAEASRLKSGVSASRRGVAAGRDVSGNVFTGDVQGAVNIDDAKRKRKK